MKLTLNKTFKSLEIEKCTKEQFVSDIYYDSNKNNFELFDFNHYQYESDSECNYEIFYFEKLDEVKDLIEAFLN